jgi:hypothetical protein
VWLKKDVQVYMVDRNANFGLFDDDALELTGDELERRLNEVMPIVPNLGDQAIVSGLPSRSDQHSFDLLPARIVSGTVAAVYAGFDIARTVMKYVSSK